MTLNSLITGKTTVHYFKADEPAAGHQFSIVPSVIYRFAGGKLPPVLASLVKAGVLTPLSGPPGEWVDVAELTAAQLTATPPPEPAIAKPIRRSEVLQRLGWDAVRLQRAIARHSFPKNDVTFSSADPTEAGESGWYWSTVEKWIKENADFIATR